MDPRVWKERERKREVPCKAEKACSEIEIGLRSSPTTGSICTGYFLSGATLK